jgi:hypothetical protein
LVKLVANTLPTTAPENIEETDAGKTIGVNVLDARIRALIRRKGLDLADLGRDPGHNKSPKQNLHHSDLLEKIVVNITAGSK